MPRRSRTGSGGLVIHVLNRGAKRSRLFADSQDFVAFEDLLTETQEVVQIPLLAYCLMPNHWHLVMWPHKDGDLSRFMHHLTGTHAQRWNSAHGCSGEGAVYQGRYKAIPVQRDDHFLRLCRYVERNPLAAGLVSHVSEWRWSSLWRRLNCVSTGFLASWPVPAPADWVDRIQAPDEREEADVRQAIAANKPLGGEQWREETTRRLHLTCMGHRGRPRKNAAEKTSRPLFPET